MQDPGHSNPIQTGTDAACCWEKSSWIRRLTPTNYRQTDLERTSQSVTLCICSVKHNNLPISMNLLNILDRINAPSPASSPARFCQFKRVPDADGSRRSARTDCQTFYRDCTAWWRGVAVTRCVPGHHISLVHGRSVRCCFASVGAIFRN